MGCYLVGQEATENYTSYKGLTNFTLHPYSALVSKQSSNSVYAGNGRRREGQGTPHLVPVAGSRRPVDVLQSYKVISPWHQRIGTKGDSLPIFATTIFLLCGAIATLFFAISVLAASSFLQKEVSGQDFLHISLLVT